MAIRDERDLRLDVGACRGRARAFVGGFSAEVSVCAALKAVVAGLCDQAAARPPTAMGRWRGRCWRICGVGQNSVW